MPSKKRLTFVTNRNHKFQKLGVCEPKWNAVIQMASNKFRIKVKRVFLENGQELTSEQIEKLEDGMIVVCSAGEDFGGEVTKKKILDRPRIDCKILAIDSYIDHVSKQQMDNACKLQGVVRVRGLPDLHAGNGIPVGAACLIQNRVYPHLVGTDIGCGMGFYTLNTDSNRFVGDRVAKKLRQSDIDKGWHGDLAQFTKKDLPCRDKLGTVGAGNHFAEFMVVDEVVDPALFESCGVRQDKVHLLVHSGSRSYGKQIYDSFASGGSIGLDPGRKYLHATTEFLDYRDLHNKAMEYARVNRDIIAYRMAQIVGSQEKCLFHLFHNFVEPVELEEEKYWLHRKGVAAVKKEHSIMIVPGSRGDYSYLVAPQHDRMEDCLWSIAHGAGRRISRGAVKRTLPVEKLTITPLGNPVVCDDKNLLYEEAPQAYKDVGVVVDDLVKLGLIQVVAKMRPILTYKTLG